MNYPSHIYSVSLHDLSLGYPGRELFTGASVGFGKGEFTALIGRNGAGKSTLLRTIAGLLRPLGGHIEVDGRDSRSLGASRRAELISFVSTDDIRVAGLKVYDVVGMGRAPYTNWIGTLSDEDRHEVEKALELVGMSSFSKKSIDTLSDGERQRVMIARSLAQNTPIILLDEPTAFLDLPNKYEISLLLRELSHVYEKTVIFSTHDMNIALELCDMVVMIEDGKFVHGTTAQMIERGDLNRLFSGTSVEFDALSGTIKCKKEKK